MADQKRYDVKQSGQPRQFPPGDSNSLARYVAAAQHVTSVSSSGILNPLYLSQQQQSLSTLHPSFSTQSLGSSPHSGRDYHPHQSHSQGMELSGGLPQRTHLVNAGLGLSLNHSSMHIPQHRRPSGQRVSLLRDIGIAGERERDRTETSVSSVLPHSFSAVSGVQSHLMTSPLMYSNRSGLSMLGGLQAAQQSMMIGSLQSQSVSPRHTAIQPPGQVSRSLPAGTIHQFPGGPNQFLSSAQAASIKTEPGLLGTIVKEEPGLSKPQMISGSMHYPHLLSSHSMTSHQPTTSSIGIKHEQQQQQEKESENQPGKEELLQAMEKVDKEISKVQQEISRLDRKKQQLETAAKKPPQQEKPASPKKVEPKHRDLWQVIYAENKKKAEQASGLLSQLGPQYEMPVYNQPCDTQVYQDNLKKNEIMRPKLLAYFQKRSQLCNIRERYLCARYDQLMAEWQKKSEKIEMNIKRKAKESKVREFFEKQFPEIRKQREQQERFSRSGTRGDTCRSEADFNEIVDGLTEQEHHEQHMRQLAVVPPMLLDRDERRLKFINNNGLVQDPLQDYKKQQQLDHWSIQEKEIFKEKYIQHPKNFNLIASFLEKKKTVNYKNLARKHTLKPRKPKSGRGHTQQQSATASTSQDVVRNNQQSDKDSEMKKDSPDLMIKEEEEERIDRPPSPRITRSRNKTLNWTDEDIVMVKDGFGKHGKDFAAIARMFTNKTEHQVKNFFHNYKKKHNLDQVIADGKKKKPNEGRKTRACNQPSESGVLDDESDTGRPKSTEPLSSSSSDTVEGNKKRKKDADPEVREYAAKIDETDSSPLSAANTEKESTSTSRGSTPVGGSTIRTRRSAAAANSTSESRSESAKRSSESSPVDEPAEKKMKKSKSPKEQKQPPSPNEGKSSSAEFLEKDSAMTETETSNGKMVGDESTPTTTENDEKKDEKASASESDNRPSVSDATIVSGTIASAEAVASVVATTTSSHDTTRRLKQMGSEEQQSREPKLKISKPTDSKDVIDGDSSATCSADEDPNMQDVSDVNKNDKRKNVDSPYAFNEYTTDPIKLESRLQQPPELAMASTAGMSMKSECLKPDQLKDSRPSSTNTPQVMASVPDEKRPQSLPPAPGVAVATSTLRTLRFPTPPLQAHPLSGDAHSNLTSVQIPGCPPFMSALTMPSQHMSPYPIPSSMFQPSLVPLGGVKHIVGKVPEHAEFLSALTGDKAMESLPQSQNQSIPGAVRPSTLGSSGSKNIQTIDLTKPSEGERKQQEEKISSAPRHPPYHAVSLAASSMQKDFLLPKVDQKTMQDYVVTHPHNYTSVQIAAMHDRAAVLPIVSVSSLLFPMPSSMQTSVAKETLKSTTDKATIKSVGRPVPDPIDRGHTPTGVIYQKGDHNNPHLIHPTLVQGHLKFTQPPLTTSFIPTKYVSAATMASAAQKNKPASVTVLMSGDGLQQVIKPSIDVTKRQPLHAEEAINRMNDPTKKIIPISRASIVKGTPIPWESSSGSLTRTPGLEDPVPGTISPSPGLKGYQTQNHKSVSGSIVTGIPICKSHDPKQLGRPGKDVRSLGPDQASSSGIDSRIVSEGDVRGPFGTVPMHYPGRMQAGIYQVPYPPSAVGLRGPAPSGSILAGTPVKRKISDDSNSSLSPSANLPPFPGVVMSRDSPTSAPHAPRQQDRKAVRGSPADIRGPIHPAFSQLITGAAAFEKMKKEADMYAMLPEKMREHSSRSAASSPRLQHGISSQYPSIKQEVPSSPRADDHSRRPTQPMAHSAMDPMTAAAVAAAATAGNNEMLRLPMGVTPFQIPFPGLPAANTPNELMDILRQYNAPNLYPIYPGIHQYQSGLLSRMAAGGSPNVPGSPQTVGDENMENTKKIMSQDFATAKLIMQQTGLNPGPSALGFSPGPHPITNPAPHLVVSGTSAYHSLANNSFHPGASLPVDRLHFIPQHSIGMSSIPNAAVAAARGIRSPFSPQYQPQSGRSSSARSPIPISPSESSRSPVHQPTKTASPDFVRQRHLSSELHRDSRPPVRDHYSPASPLAFHSPRSGSGHTSPREHSSSMPIHRQQSPSHPSQRQVITTQPTKPYYQYASSSSPPNQAPYPTYPASGLSPRHGSSGLPGQRHYPDIPGNTKSKRPPDPRSSPFHNKHSRTGSLDSGKQHTQEKMRPDSAGPYPRSLPQSPHVQPGLDPHLYGGSIKQESRLSPKPQVDKKSFSIASMIGPDGAKRCGRQEELIEQQHASWQRASPRPPVKQQPQMDVPGHGSVESRHLSLAMSSQSTSSHLAASGQRVKSGFPPKLSSPFPKDLARGQQSHMTRPGDKKNSSEEGIQVSSKVPSSSNMSLDPAKDLIRNGRATMTAANLLYAIIDSNYHQSKDPAEKRDNLSPIGQKPPESASAPGKGSSQTVGGIPKQPGGNAASVRSSDKHQGPAVKQENVGSNSARFETEGQQPPCGIPPALFSQFRPPILTPRTGEQESLGSSATRSASPNSVRTFAQHSSDVINDLYRKTPTELIQAAASTRSRSPLILQPAGSSIMTEPISPPTSRSTNNKVENTKPSMQPHQPQYQMPSQHHRFPPASVPATTKEQSGRLAMQAAQLQQRPSAAQIPMTQPMQFPPNTSSSLEAIIRKALMNPQNCSPSPPPDIRRLQDQQAGMIPPKDLFLTHAMMISMPRPAVPATSAELLPKSKALDPWKETQVASSQTPQNSGYMSALMLRQMPSTTSPQNSQAPSVQTPDNRQQFYSTQASRSNLPPNPASQPQQEINNPPPPQQQQQQQCHQAPAMLPQYEALSDSD